MSAVLAILLCSAVPLQGMRTFLIIYKLFHISKLQTTFIPTLHSLHISSVEEKNSNLWGYLLEKRKNLVEIHVK